MFHDIVKVTGNVTVTRFHEDGSVDAVFEFKNLVVTAGKTHIAARMTSSPPSVMSHMAIGAPSSTVTPLSTDTTLATEIARVPLTVAGGEASANTVTYTATFPAGTGTSANISEAGIFNQNSGGIMLCRTTFASISKGAGQAFGISWTITFN